MTTRKPYSTDISNSPWAILKPLIPPPKPGGRPRTVKLREIISAFGSKSEIGSRQGAAVRRMQSEVFSSQLIG